MVQTTELNVYDFVYAAATPRSPATSTSRPGSPPILARRAAGCRRYGRRQDLRLRDPADRLRHHAENRLQRDGALRRPPHNTSPTGSRTASPARAIFPPWRRARRSSTSISSRARTRPRPSRPSVASTGRRTGLLKFRLVAAQREADTATMRRVETRQGAVEGAPPPPTRPSSRTVVRALAWSSTDNEIGLRTPSTRSSSRRCAPLLWASWNGRLASAPSSSLLVQAPARLGSRQALSKGRRQAWGAMSWWIDFGPHEPGW